MHSDDVIIAHTKEWVSAVVIGDNFCPFARKEMVNNSIRYVVCSEVLEDTLVALISECKTLDDAPSTETSLLIYPKGFDDFKVFLELTALADNLMADQGYEGVYQLASFHPDYCFADSSKDDPANYTNRSPYPTLHLIREESIERVLQDIENPEKIPERNIRYARDKGLSAMQAKLNACMQKK